MEPQWRRRLIGFCLLHPAGKKAFFASFASWRFDFAAKKAALDVSLNEFGRKSFAMKVLGAGIDKAVVSHLLRHQDPRMIDHYAEYQTQPLKSVLDKVQSLDTIGISPDRKNEVSY